MSPGLPDQKVVHDRLALIEACLHGLRNLPVGSLDEFLADHRNPAAADSLLRRALESLLDLARHLLAKGVGQQALEYRQVARLARERGLIQDQEIAERFVLLAGYRNRLTHFYSEVTPEELFGILRQDLGDVEAVAEELRRAAMRLASEAGST